jgi:predicted GNAT family acetyltransferase
MAAGRLWMWEDEDGRTAAMAGRTATSAGVARIAPVYTPPEHRRRGYGAAVTAACTADALARDADHVVLFTDRSNATSNSVYRRIGFRPIAEREVVHFD